MRNDQQFFSRPAVEAGGRRWDWAVLPLMLALLVVIAYGASQMAVEVRANAPAIFLTSGSLTPARGLVVNQDGSSNTPGNPVVRWWVSR